MYYKLSSIVLNSGKNLNHSGDVHIAQPNAELESLAGNFFVIVEMPDKRAVSQKVCDFLVSRLEEYYYGDHKLFLTDKIEGLKVASIFEAALARTNLDFSAFLQEEDITLNSSQVGLTIGLIYRNKLYFSIFGKNKAFLIYRKGAQYDILNVESSAQESEEEIAIGEEGLARAKVFSAVINGEIPPYSYFVFSNEALPEYLSSQDMISLVVKLPPVVACEQMKNVLSGINSFIPFLGIVIKNVYNTQENIEGSRTVESLTAHESISNLNYTERRTEKMLSPAGLIDLKKIAGKVNKLRFKLPSFKVPMSRTLAWRDKNEAGSSEMRKDSFMIKDKIVLKKQARNWAFAVKKTIFAIASLFRPSAWQAIWQGSRAWFSRLSRANRLILVSLFAILVILVVSILTTMAGNRQKEVREQFAAAENLLQAKMNSINWTIDNRVGLQSDWLEVSATISALPQEKDWQKEQYQRLQELSSQLHDKAYGITRLAISEKVWEAGEGKNLVGGTFTGNQAVLLDAENKKLEIVSLTEKTSEEAVLDYDLSQINPRLYAYEGRLFLLQSDAIIRYDLEDKTSNRQILPQMPAFGDIGGWGVFVTNSADSIYLADSKENQIFRYRITGGSVGGKAGWIEEETVSMTDVLGLYVDNGNGHIYAVHNDGKLDDYYLNQRTDVSFDALETPPSASAFLLQAGDRIGLADLKNRSLALWSKEGKLEQQYVFDGVSQMIAFGLSDDGQTAYIFDGRSLYSIPLSQ